MHEQRAVREGRCIGTTPENRAKYELGDARVLSVCGERRYLVSTPSGVRSVGRAFGCLVDPVGGDHVLLLSSDRGEQILQVLDRNGSDTAAETHISSTGPMMLHARAGDVRIRSAADIRFHSGRSIHHVADSMRWAVRTLTGVMTTINLRARHADWHIQQIDAVGDRLRYRVNEVLGQCRIAIRDVAATETLRAGTLVQRVQGLWSMQSRRTTLDSKRETRINGDQIHMG